MDIQTFVTESKKLIAKYGNDKISRELLNEVWFKIKNFDNEYIIDKVNILLTKKSVYADKFYVDDFLPNNNDENITNIDEKKVKKIKRSYEKSYEKPKYNWGSGFGLNNALSKLGASDLVDAIEIVKRKGLK